MYKKIDGDLIELAGGDWDKIKTIIQQELKDCDVTVVIYNK